MAAQISLQRRHSCLRTAVYGLQAKKDRVQFETELSTHGSHLGSLPQSNLAAWPEAVQSLVRTKVDAAVGETHATLHDSAITALEQADAERTILKRELQQTTSRASDLEARWQVSQAQEEQLRGELREQEAALQQQISALQLKLERVAAASTHMQGPDDRAKQQLREAEVCWLLIECHYPNPAYLAGL